MQEDLLLPRVSDDELGCARVEISLPDNILGGAVAVIKEDVLPLFDVGLVVAGALYIFPNRVGNAKGPAHTGAIRSFFQREMEAGDEFDRSLKFLAFEHRNQSTDAHHTRIARFHHHQALLLFRHLDHRVAHFGHVHLPQLRMVRPIKQSSRRNIQIHLRQVMALANRFVKVVQIFCRLFAVARFKGMDQFTVPQQHIGTQSHCAVTAFHQLFENDFELFEVRFG